MLTWEAFQKPYCILVLEDVKSPVEKPDSDETGSARPLPFHVERLESIFV